MTAQATAVTPMKAYIGSGDFTHLSFLIDGKPTGRTHCGRDATEAWIADWTDEVECHKCYRAQLAHPDNPRNRL